MFLDNKLSAEQRVQKAVVAIMSHPKYVALAGILMIGKREVLEYVPPYNTAATNGRDEMYSRELVDHLTDPMLRFVILHESYHKLYKHLTTWQHLYRQDPQRANMAADFCINCKIVDDHTANGKLDGFIEIPTDKDGKPFICLDTKYRGMDTAQIFHQLGKDGKGNKSGGGKDGQPGADGKDGDGATGFDSHDWEGAKALSDTEKQALSQEIDRAIRQGALAAGKTGSGVDRSIEELLEPQVDWRDVLREFVQTTCTGKDYSTWRRPNRRYMSSGHYMPSSVSERIGEIAILPDMSGSTARIVGQFLGEAKAIAEVVRPERIRLLYWDTEVVQDETYEMHELDNMINATKPKGGGGTNIEPVAAYMREHKITPQAIVILTDGGLYAGWGTWDAPTLWCIVDNKDCRSPVGRTVNIDSNRL